MTEVLFRYVIDDPADFRWDPPTDQWVRAEITFTVERGTFRRLRRWIRHPDQAPTKPPVPFKGRR